MSPVQRGYTPIKSVQVVCFLQQTGAERIGKKWGPSIYGMAASDRCATLSAKHTRGIVRMDLDRIDREILLAVQADGRITNASLADSVGLSETPCARRLRRLEADGFIEGYRATLSRKALDLGLMAFTQVRFGAHDRELSERFEREVQGIPRIVACHNVTGTADYMLTVVARDLDDYGVFVRDVIRTLPGVTAVESVLSLREVKRHSGLPLL